MAATLDDVVCSSLVVRTTAVLPSQSIRDAHIQSAAEIDASKVRHQVPIRYDQPPGTAVVAETRELHIARGSSAALVSFEAAITGAVATGADRTVTVDLQRSTGGGAYATVLTASIVFDSSTTLRTVSAATLASTTLADNDLLRVVVSVAGSAGAQAQGLAVTLRLWESPS